MRLWIISDLHVVGGLHWELPTDMRDKADVVVLAGDISVPLARSLKWLVRRRDEGIFGDAKIVMVAGNHEFYGADKEPVTADGVALAAQLGIHFLHRSSVVIGNVRFLGCTLWTDYDLYGTPAEAMKIAGRVMNDHHMIRIGEHRYAPQDALSDHQRDLAWLKGTLAEPHSGPMVVVTHHGISKQSVHAKYADDPVTPSFSSNLDALVEGSGAALWVHGHTHSSFDYRIGSTRVVCNPKGYGPTTPGERIENAAFDPRLVIEIGA